MIRPLRWAGGKLADWLFGPDEGAYVSRTTLESVGQPMTTVEEIVRAQVCPVELEPE